MRVQLDSRPEVIDRLERKRLQLEIELRQITKEQGGRYSGLLELFRGAITENYRCFTKFTAASLLLFFDIFFFESCESGAITGGTVHAAPLLRR